MISVLFHDYSCSLLDSNQSVQKSNALPSPASGKHGLYQHTFNSGNPV